MPKFRIEYTRAFYGNIVIEADTETEAEDIFYETDLGSIDEQNEVGSHIDYIEEI